MKVLGFNLIALIQWKYT